VSGVYFLKTIDRIVPSVNFFNEKGIVSAANIFAITEEVFKADHCYPGFLLIHRDVIKTMIKELDDNILFKEEFVNNDIVPSDVYFFKKLKECGIELYVVKNAIVDYVDKIKINLPMYMKDEISRNN
jgi:hypothetical protein